MPDEEKKVEEAAPPNPEPTPAPAPEPEPVLEEIQPHDSTPDVIKWLGDFETRITGRFDKLESGSKPAEPQEPKPEPEPKKEVEHAAETNKQKPNKKIKLFKRLTK